MGDPHDRWVLLHGTPLTPEVWDDVAARLRQRGEVHCPDLSSVPAGAASQRDLAEQALHGIDAGDGLHVVGHSFGGQVAMELALLHPLSVRSLTIVCSRDVPFPPFAASAAAVRSGAPVDVEAGIARWFRPDEIAADAPVVRYARERLRDADRESWAAALDAIAGYDRSAELGRIRMPVTLVAGEFDLVATPAVMAAMADRLPRAELTVIPDAAHLSPFLDPDSLADRIERAAATLG